MVHKMGERKIQGLYDREDMYYFLLARVLLRETRRTKRRNVSDEQQKA